METVSLVVPESPEISFFDLLLKGGPVMVPIIILSLIAVYIMVQRYLYLRSVTRNRADFMAQIKKSLNEGDMKSAYLYADQDASAVGKVVRSGLESLGRPAREIEMMMETSANIEVAEMEKGLGYLGIIAGIAPMLGFIGTISGIIQIFYNISLSDNISIGIIAGGLYEKMVSSGSGLIVGVFSYVAYHALQLKIGRVVLNIQKSTFEFMKTVALK